MKTIATIEREGAIVKIHEEEALRWTKHRYFIALNGFVRGLDSDRSKFWLGSMKSEATREGTALADKVALAIQVLRAAKDLAAKEDTATNRTTVNIQTDRLRALTDKYVYKLN